MGKNRIAVNIVTIIALLIAMIQSITFPVSMAVVRNVVPPLTVSTYLSKIGCCQFDSNG